MEAEAVAGDGEEMAVDETYDQEGANIWTIKEKKE